MSEADTGNALSPTHGGGGGDDGDAVSGMKRRREVFWHNVVREILNALSAAASSSGRLKASASGAAMSAAPTDEVFDGRMAVVTRLGQRIPIADVFPVFACSVSTTKRDRMLSADVQCTVFQIRTPGGEVYTLPVHEIVAIHSLSEELLTRMEEAAEADGSEEGSLHERPFGFAAFTSLAKAEREAMEAQNAPEELDT